MPHLQHVSSLEEANAMFFLFFLCPLELISDPGISVNASANGSFLAEGRDSVVATCLTNSSNIKWYVNWVQTSGSNRMTISPDGKTLEIHWVRRYDDSLYCVIEDFPGLLQRSKRIPLTVACE